MDKRVDEIIATLNTISLEIVVPLRGKVIDTAAFSELFELMGELQELLYNEKAIPKELVEISFHIYTQLDMQASYVKTEEVKKEIIVYQTKMRSKMRGIFGTGTQQKARSKELSVKDIMDSTGKKPQDIMDEFKNLYD